MHFSSCMNYAEWKRYILKWMQSISVSQYIWGFLSSYLVRLKTGINKLLLNKILYLKPLKNHNDIWSDDPISLFTFSGFIFTGFILSCVWIMLNKYKWNDVIWQWSDESINFSDSFEVSHKPIEDCLKSLTKLILAIFASFLGQIFHFLLFWSK